MSGFGNGRKSRRERHSVECYISGSAGYDRSDAGYGDARENLRVLARGEGEEELVVFAAVERVVERGTGENRRGRDRGGDAGFGAEAGEIEREAVAEVHGGCGDVA